MARKSFNRWPQKVAKKQSEVVMPGKGGNKWKPSPTARYSEGYGEEEIVGNPGAQVTRRKKVSDAIRGWGSHNSKTPYGNK
jgi:hypothetical protein